MCNRWWGTRWWGFQLMSQLDRLYLAAAAWRFLHQCRHPPLASSPAPWSACPRRFLQPPSYFPGLGPSAKPSVRKNWKLITYCLTSAVNYAADASTACSKHWRMLEYFPVLGKDFGHPLPTWLWMANGGQGQERFRAEGKVWGEADIHQCRSDLTFRGTLLCSAEDEHRLKCLSLYAVIRCLKREACKAK